MNKFVKTIILFIVGYCVYIAIEVTYKGSSYPIMGICGGISIVILDKINDVLSWDTDIILQGLIGCALITLMELIIGEVSIHTDLLPVMWDYSNIPLNYKGIICLPFSIVWFILSILTIMLADVINYYVFGEEPTPYYKLFNHVLLRFVEK